MARLLGKKASLDAADSVLEALLAENNPRRAQKRLEKLPKPSEVRGDIRQHYEVKLAAAEIEVYLRLDVDASARLMRAHDRALRLVMPYVVINVDGQAHESMPVISIRRPALLRDAIRLTAVCMVVSGRRRMHNEAVLICAAALNMVESFRGTTGADEQLERGIISLMADSLIAIDRCLIALDLIEGHQEELDGAPHIRGELLVKKALAYSEMGQHGEATVSLRQAAIIQPRSEVAAWYFGWLLTRGVEICSRPTKAPAHEIMELVGLAWDLTASSNHWQREKLRGHAQCLIRNNGPWLIKYLNRRSGAPIHLIFALEMSRPTREELAVICRTEPRGSISRQMKLG